MAAQVALARRESPHRGQQHLGLARVLTREMPHTLAAFRQGRVSEWRTMLMVRETACLELAERRAVDEEVARGSGGLRGRWVTGRWWWRASGWRPGWTRGGGGAAPARGVASGG